MKIEFDLDEDEEFTPLRIAEALERELPLRTIRQVKDFLEVMLKQKECEEREQGLCLFYAG